MILSNRVQGLMGDLIPKRSREKAFFVVARRIGGNLKLDELLGELEFAAEPDPFNIFELDFDLPAWGEGFDPPAWGEGLL